jgi:transposase
MSTVPLYVGLDYHQSSIQVCAMDGTGRVLLNRACENRWQAVGDLVLTAGAPVRVALEACTGAADLAQELVDLAGWSVDLAHTTYVARMKRQPDKTDYSDARLLADLTRVGYLPRVWLPPRYIRDLRRLVSLRHSLVDQRRNLKLRLTGLLRDHRVRTPYGRWTKPWRAWVQAPDTLPAVGRLIAGEVLQQLEDVAARIGRVEEQMGLFSAGDPIVTYLRTRPCIGPVTAWVLRAAIGDVSRFHNGKQLAHYCGLSPANASSGKRVADAGLISTGDPHLRATLIELAHRLRRTQPRWQAFGQALAGRGKPGSVIAAAIANRFIRQEYHAWKGAQAAAAAAPPPAQELVDRRTGEVSSPR